MTINFDGHTISASEEMLNMLALWAYEAAETIEKNGHPLFADYAAKFGAKVVHDLREAGYYEPDVTV